MLHVQVKQLLIVLQDPHDRWKARQAVINMRGRKFCIHERQLEERAQSWVWACPGCSPWQRVAQSTS